MFVAELHNHYKDSATSVLPAPIPGLMILLGMFMAGYPQDAPQNAHWSHTMQKLSKAVNDSSSRGDTSCAGGGESAAGFELLDA